MTGKLLIEKPRLHSIPPSTETITLHFNFVPSKYHQRVAATTSHNRKLPSWLSWTLIGALAFLLLWAVWIGVRLGLAAHELATARSELGKVTSEQASDADALLSHLKQAGGHLTTAAELTSDPMTQLSGFIPFIGSQIHAVSVLSESLDATVNHALVPAINVGMSNIAAFTPQDGNIDIAAVDQMAKPLETASELLDQANIAVQQLEPSLLLSPLAAAVREAQGQVQTARDVTAAMANATALLPTMLGRDGPRNYLLLFQNTAEWRSLGGLASAHAIVHVENGHAEISEQTTSADISYLENPPEPLSPEIDNIFGENYRRWFSNVTQLPDFTWAAPLAKDIWQREMGGSIDGVFAVDPVALSYLLRATGPITLESGEELTADNATAMLLSDVYRSYPNPADQDQFFTEVAAAVFQKMTAGSAEPLPLIKALAQAGAEHRILLWSAAAAEQDIIANTTLAGSLPVSDADSTVVGMYLNDGTGSKMDWYLTPSTTLNWNPDGSGLTASLTLSDTAPADAATSLPGYVTGGGSSGVPAGTTRTTSYLFVPNGFTLTSSSATSQLSQSMAQLGEYTVITWVVDLQPGESATLNLEASGPRTDSLALRITPTIPR